MPTFYFEFTDTAKNKIKFPHKYGFKVVNDYRGDAAYGTSVQYVYYAERIWVENDNGSVSWAKNRFFGQSSIVDLDEFFWIKLQCRPL